MPTITIPQELAQEKKLIAIPHKTYEEFLEWRRKLKSRHEFKPTAREKNALLRARKNVARGAYITLTELHDALGVKD